MSLTSKQYHHGDLKAAVLDRAAEIIATDGLEALSLRGIARDLGVSHGAPNRHLRNKAELLANLAANGWHKITTATLEAAEAGAAQHPSARLNAMGRGFLSWALQNPSLFQTITHPDVWRHADSALRAAQEDFRATIRQAIEAAQGAGRHPDVNRSALLLYTNAVAFGAAMLMANPQLSPMTDHMDLNSLINTVIDMAVPVDSNGTTGHSS